MALMMVSARLNRPALIQHLAAYYREVGCMTFHPTHPAAWLSLRVKQRKEYPREDLITLLQITVVIAWLCLRGPLTMYDLEDILFRPKPWVN